MEVSQLPRVHDVELHPLQGRILQGNDRIRYPLYADLSKGNGCR